MPNMIIGLSHSTYLLNKNVTIMTWCFACEDGYLHEAVVVKHGWTMILSTLVEDSWIPQHHVLVQEDSRESTEDLREMVGPAICAKLWYLLIFG